MIDSPTGIARALACAILLTSAAGYGQSAAELIAKGDVSDRSFKPVVALQSYLPAEKLEPDNLDLLLRISRQYRHMMSDAKTPAEKLRLGQTALAYDKRSAALGPRSSDAQLSSAITRGKMAPFLGKKEQVAASPLIKAAADRAIKLDPRNDSAWHVLGRWHQSLAAISGVKRGLGELIYGSLPKGSNAESVACFDKAIAINPNRLRHHIQLGRTYAQMGKSVDARRSLEKGLAMPEREKDDWEEKKRGREILAKLP
jgi:tetratricopeptide (TPR) repeat protein